MAEIAQTVFLSERTWSGAASAADQELRGSGRSTGANRAPPRSPCSRAEGPRSSGPRAEGRATQGSDAYDGSDMREAGRAPPLEVTPKRKSPVEQREDPSAQPVEESSVG